MGHCACASGGTGGPDGLPALALVEVVVENELGLGRIEVRGWTTVQTEAEDLLTWDHGGGFSLDANVRIEATDRTGLERLLRYCSR